MRFEAPLALAPAPVPSAAMTGYARGEADFAAEAERFRRDARPASLAHKDYSVPLHVDCSIEYELPDCAKPPQGVKIEPLLMIHPAHFRRLESLRRVPFVNNLPRAAAAAAEALAARTPRARPQPRRCCRAAPAPAAPAQTPAAAAEHRLLLGELLHPAPAPGEWATRAAQRAEYASCAAPGKAGAAVRRKLHAAHPYLVDAASSVGLDCDMVMSLAPASVHVQGAATHAHALERRGLRQLPIYM